MGIEYAGGHFTNDNGFANQNSSFDIGFGKACRSSCGYVSGHFNGKRMDSLIDTALFKGADEIGIDIS